MRHDTDRRGDGNTFAEPPTAIASRLETDSDTDTLGAMNLPSPLARDASSRQRLRGNLLIVQHSRVPAWCRWALLCGVTLGCLLRAHLASAGGFVLVKKGKPGADIVVGEEPALPILFAAQELQRYVKEMSGAELPIVKTTSKRPAVVLASLQPDKARVDDPREEDYYRLNIATKTLSIEGASPRAVLFGAYDVLERLGCGWCVPGDDVVPKRDTLELAPLRADTRPAFQYRMMLDFPMLSVAQTVAIADWIAKNRMNWVHECPNAHGAPTAWYERRERVVPELTKRGLHLLVGGHTMHTWVPETNFAAHPEWFALEDGKRKPPTLCISQAEMTAELIKNMQRCLEVDVVDLWHTDSEVFCHCAKCTRGVATEGPNHSRPASLPADAVRSAY